MRTPLNLNTFATKLNLARLRWSTTYHLDQEVFTCIYGNSDHATGIRVLGVISNILRTAGVNYITISSNQSYVIIQINTNQVYHVYITINHHYITLSIHRL